VSLAALQVLATYDYCAMIVDELPALQAILTFCLIQLLCPMLRGIHFLLIWIEVILHILSAVIAIIMPDPR